MRAQLGVEGSDNSLSLNDPVFRVAKVTDWRVRGKAEVVSFVLSPPEIL